MTQARQQAFQRLRPPCVELSSVALQLKARQASPKAVLLALEPVHGALQILGDENQLDEKLAEYAFFPLTHIFNQSRQLSSHILQVAVQCVEILVSRGWRTKLAPEMAKQLLILMGLLVSQSPSQQGEPATDELKVASFTCMSALIVQSAHAGSAVSDEVGDKSVVDQLVYQLLEAISTTSSDQVQIAAAQALFELNNAIEDRVLLASLLPRTASTLVQVLRPSTKARRPRTVLVAYLKLLALVLRKIFDDDALSTAAHKNGPGNPNSAPNADQLTVLDKSWLDATTPQIELALVQVVKLRTHDAEEVAQALLQLCLLIIEDCTQSLAASVPVMVETLVSLCRSAASSQAMAALKHLVMSRPEVNDILSARFYDWSQILPRVMQGNEDKPKERMLGQVAVTFGALAEITTDADDVMSRMAAILVDSTSAAIGAGATNPKIVDQTTTVGSVSLLRPDLQHERQFSPVLLNHESQIASTQELNNFVALLRSHSYNSGLTRNILNHVADPDPSRRLAATWLALKFLQRDDSAPIEISFFIDDESSELDLSLSRPFLVSDLYALTVPTLIEHAESNAGPGPDWRLVALSLESLILQASQLGNTYRPELMDTLFPVLSLLGSASPELQNHAMTALNLLAAACEYDSPSALVIENVDYLVNSISLRLNAFDVSRDGLQVLAMMIRLCGARLLPHLDDLIGSIFGALDNFHGYPGLVEVLFGILKLIVEESARKPTALAIKMDDNPPHVRDPVGTVSTIDDVLADLRSNKARQGRSDEEHAAVTSTPQRPWTDTLDGPTPAADDEPVHVEDEEEEESVAQKAHDPKEPPLSKSHQLLLKIAESAVPHLSSPSPQVRLTLLQLIQEICPLLARHKNSFLPLVNAVWPAVVPRLLGRGEDTVRDMPYTVQAAADTVSALCRAAGDFMASRIETVFPELEAFFKKTRAGIAPRSQQRVLALNRDGHASSLASSSGAMRTSNGQILESLVTLLTCLLENVRLSEDNVDKIFEMLGPLATMSRKINVEGVLRKYNEDALWVMEHAQAR